MLTIKRPNRLPIALQTILGGTLGALLLALCFAVPALAAEPPLLPHRLRDGFDEGRLLRVQGPRQVFRGDLTVEEGEVIEDDVTLYSGNVDVQEGGRITGDLIVFSGNIETEEGSTIEGDIINYSGDVTVAGRVGGDLLVWSGNVELAATATVDGDVGVASGNLDREAGSTISGDVIQGPSFRFPGRVVPNVPDVPKKPGISFGSEPHSFFGSIMGFIGRLFVAALMTAFTMLLVGGLFYLRPQLIADTRKQLHEHLALSAVIGAVANLTIIFLASLLAITVCLLPLALVPMLLLLAVNVVGWSVASQIAGERIVTVAKQEVQPALTILVGALFLTGVCALLWAFGGCFRFLAFLLIFVVSSLGTGAVLAPWVNRSRGASGAGGTNGGNVPPSEPVPPSGPAPSGAPAVYDAPVETTTVETDVAAPIDYVTAEEVNTAAEQPPAQAPKARARGGKRAAETSSSAESPAPEGATAEPVEQDVAAPIDYVTAQEVITTDTVTEGDDFLQIKGIGPTYARRLKDAGYATFAQLAAASPEEIAAAIGWPVDRVRRSEVIDQAKVLAQR
jgi:predicted flap endonuclease-1-like 5' DNA nuclease/cytoskeletal protein CcmA (bactofilin family)